MTSPINFATPQIVDDPSICQFYHRIDLPGIGEVGDQWDLRETIDSYLGDYDFSGKRVLDVGTAAGFLTFEIERRGAREVVSFDMDDGAQWDLVPQASVRQDPEAYLKYVREDHHRLKNAYWFAHGRLKSKARVFYGDIYQLPKGLGPFDVGVMGMIVGHLRDPLQAIANVANLCNSHLIITNQANFRADPSAHLIPTRDNAVVQAWWSLSDTCLKRFLEVLGFEVERVVRSFPKCLVKGREGPEQCMSLVSHRVE